MRTKLTVLAVAALLALGTGSVVAAMDAPTADTTMNEALPANYTVDVSTPGEVTDADVERAITTTWRTDEIRDDFSDEAAVHFDIRTVASAENVVQVDVAPLEEPAQTRVVAQVNLTAEQTVQVLDPVTLTVSNATSTTGNGLTTISVADTACEDHTSDESDGENATRLTANQSIQFDLNESSIDDSGNGTITVTIDATDENNTTAASPKNA